MPDLIKVRLHETVSAVCPILGVSGPQGSVRVDYAPAATVPQQAAAQAAVAAFDWSAGAQTAWERGREPGLRDLLDQADAAIAAIDAYLPGAASASNAQVRAEVEAIDRRQKRIVQALRRLIQREWRD